MLQTCRQKILACIFLLCLCTQSFALITPTENAGGIQFKGDKTVIRKERKKPAVVSKQIVSKETVKFSTVSTVFSDPMNAIKILPGFPARYGQMLSGVIDIKTITGSTKETKVELDQSLTYLNGLAQGPIIPNKMSWLVSARETIHFKQRWIVLSRSRSASYGQSFISI